MGLAAVKPSPICYLFGVNSGAIFNFERGRKWFTPQDVEKLLEHFGRLSEEAPVVGFVELLMSNYSRLYATRRL